MRPIFPLCWIAFLACTPGPVLVPDVGVRTVPGNETRAETSGEGVTIWVDGSAWRYDPRRLPEVLTPVQIGIDNRSNRKLRITYSEFSLVGASGFRFRALAPLPGERNASLSKSQYLKRVAVNPYWTRRSFPGPRHRPYRFYIAPHYRYWWPDSWVWMNQFPYDSRYYSDYNWADNLPTEDMIAEAIPEGVLQSGGYIEGFVYFQGVSRRERAVKFSVNLIDADNQQQFGTLEVPLVVRYP